MKEYLKMKYMFPEGVYVDNDPYYNGWTVIQVRYKSGNTGSLDDSGDGGFYEEKAKYITHAINEHDGLVATVQCLEKENKLIRELLKEAVKGK